MNIDQRVLLQILSAYVSDKDALWLLRQVIESFYSSEKGIGLPLGNLTSQLFVNIYMNEFDQFVKHRLKAKYYIRYADDFVLLSDSRAWLEAQIPRITEFLENHLHLHLHPQKLFIKTLALGVDFLGWVHFPDHRVLRTATKRRMLARVVSHPTEGTIDSYIGLLGHGNGRKLEKRIALEI